jgi:phosphoribosylanthranilate isomerase
MTCAIKICGITSADDARLVSEAGIDYLGVLVNVRQSPRSVGMDRASEIIAHSKVPVIMLTYDHRIADVLTLAEALHPRGVQLAGAENEQYILTLRDTIDGEIWKSLHLPPDDGGQDSAGAVAAQINRLARIGVDRVVLDTAISRGGVELRGGTGERCDWSAAARIRQQVDMCLFLAGGITPHNARHALLQVRPDGIDVSSGVEQAPGKKDITLVHHLVAAARPSMPHPS